MGSDGITGCYEVHCVKNTWLYCSEMLPAIRNSVIAQALPNPTKIFGNLYLRAYIHIYEPNFSFSNAKGYLSLQENSKQNQIRELLPTAPTKSLWDHISQQTPSVHDFWPSGSFVRSLSARSPAASHSNKNTFLLNSFTGSLCLSFRECSFAEVPQNSLWFQLWQAGTF